MKGTMKIEEQSETEELKATVKVVRLRWTGRRPLIMTNPQSVAMSNPHAVASREINGRLKAKRKKGATENELAEIEEQAARNDFESFAYFDPEVGFYLTTDMIQACLRQAASASRKGRDVDRAIMVRGILLDSDADDEVVPLKTKKKFKTIDEAFSDPAFRMNKPVKIPPKTGSMVVKVRPKIPSGWVAEFDVEVDTSEESGINLNDFISIAKTAGESIGIGSWRPKFGRFDCEVL